MSITLDIQDDDGVAMDISTYTFHMEVRDSDTNDSTYAISTDNNTIVAEISATTTGRVTFTSSSTTMRGLTSGLYAYDVQMNVTSDAVQTLIYGVFKVNEDVTITDE